MSETDNDKRFPDGYPTKIKLLGEITIPKSEQELKQLTEETAKEYLYVPDSESVPDSKDGLLQSDCTLKYLGEGATCITFTDGSRVIKLFYPLRSVIRCGSGETGRNCHLKSVVDAEDIAFTKFKSQLNNFLYSFYAAEIIANEYESKGGTPTRYKLYRSSLGWCAISTYFAGCTLKEYFETSTTYKDDLLDESSIRLNKIEEKLRVILKILQEVALYHKNNLLVGDIKFENYYAIKMDDGQHTVSYRNIDFGNVCYVDELLQDISRKKNEAIKQQYNVQRIVEEKLSKGRVNSAFEEEFVLPLVKKIASTRAYYIWEDILRVVYSCFGDASEERKIKILKNLDIRAIFLLIYECLGGKQFCARLRDTETFKGTDRYVGVKLDSEGLIDKIFAPAEIRDRIFQAYDLIYKMNIFFQFAESKVEDIEPDADQLITKIKEFIWQIHAWQDGRVTFSEGEGNPTDSRRMTKIRLFGFNLNQLAEDVQMQSNLKQALGVEDGEECSVADIMKYSQITFVRLEKPLTIIRSLLFEK